MTNQIQSRAKRAESPSEFDRWVQELHAGFFGGFAPAGEFVPVRAPRTDVSDTGKAYKIVAEVPGIPKEKIEVTVRGSRLEIHGENGTEETSDGEVVHRERQYAGFYRAFELPEPVVAADASAKVVNGVLELELPKLNPTPSNDAIRVAVN